MLDLSPETEALIRARAAAVGKSPNQLIWDMFMGTVPLALQPVDQGRMAKKEERLARILEIVEQVAALPCLDSRSPDEIIGYDERGLPV